jgi:iron complex outermembrane recepter protein
MGRLFGKTVKSFSAGSIAFGTFYAKGGGYRPTVIPTTDIGLIEPNSGIHFSQATSGFYSALPFADYNKYDTNEMFVSYGRERLYLSPKSTLQNSTWFTYIRRFHRRNDDALSQGSQVDEWNNPHSNIFGDEVGMTQELPFNSVKFGGYLLHEVYNAHNLFYNPTLGGQWRGSICQRRSEVPLRLLPAGRRGVLCPRRCSPHSTDSHYSRSARGRVFHQLQRSGAARL